MIVTHVLKCCILSLVGVVTIASATMHDPLHVDWINPKINLNKDFYSYANGTWQKYNPIPATESSWSQFNILRRRQLHQLHAIMQQLAQSKSLAPQSIEQQIADFYSSGMNAASIELQGKQAITPLLQQVDTVKSITDLPKLLAILHQNGVPALFSLTSMQDFYHSQNTIAVILQDGLGLPDRDYYTQQNAHFLKIRQQYKLYIARLLLLSGEIPSQATQHATKILEIETMLAQSSLTQIQQRNPKSIYHIQTRQELQKNMQHFNWDIYLQQTHLDGIQNINVAMPYFFKTLEQLLQKTDLNDLRAYLNFHIIHYYAPYLSKPFVQAAFKYQQMIIGTQHIKPRWERVVSTVNNYIDFAVGQVYIKKYFVASSKSYITEMIDQIEAAYRNVIMQQLWMEPKTKRAALIKLAKMQKQVGYPAHWPDYAKIHIDTSSYVKNIMAANQFNRQRDLNRIGKPLDPDDWSMAPQTINAYYDPSKNSMTILAGILQPPFFDPQAPAAINYGAIGFVIGHEMTHGFDDQGARFDSQGNLKNWWTTKDRKAFKTATQCIATQFSHYKINKHITLQGKLVVGEATADLGGVSLAYQAFYNSPYYFQAKSIAGFTPDQQFFLAAAHAWATNMRPELASHNATVDPHPPAQYRINGTVINLSAFQQAFHLPTVNPNLCSIWTDDLKIPVHPKQSSIIIQLPSNPTTGYVWRIKTFDHTLLTLKQSHYIAPTTHLIGAGGIMEFEFILQKQHKLPQQTIIQLTNERPWEPKSGNLKNIILLFTK